MYFVIDVTSTVIKKKPIDTNFNSWKKKSIQASPHCIPFSINQRFSVPYRKNKFGTLNWLHGGKLENSTLALS